MPTFIEANRSRISLKTFLSVYSWYHTSEVITENGQYIIVVSTTRIDPKIRNIIPMTYRNIPIRISTVGARI